MRYGLLLLLFTPLVALQWLQEEEWEACVSAERRESVSAVPPAMLVGRAVARPRAVAPEELVVSVSGRAVGPEGRPLARARVLGRWMEDDPPVACTVTDADGRFTLYGAPFDGILDVIADGVGRVQTWVECESLDDIRIRVHPGRPLRGRVLDPEGRQLVEGAVVVMEADDFGVVETRTRADGTFTIPMVPTALPFDLEVDGGDSGWKAFEDLRFAEGADLEVVLDELHGLEGRVVTCSEGGAYVGVPDVLVQAVEKCGRRSAPVCTDEDGRFQVEVCGWRGKIRARSSAWAMTAEYVAYIGVRPVRVLVEPRASVAGICLGPDGVPVAGALVEVDGTWEKGEARTDASGRFAFTGVHLTGTGVLVHARRGDELGCSHVLPGGKDDVVVRLAPTASVRARVVDERGRACPGAWIRVSFVPDPVNEPEEDESEWEQADAAGAFRVAGLPEGPCTVEIEVPGYEEERLEDVPARLEGTDLGVVRLRRLARLRGRLLDECGAPIASGGFETTPGPARKIPVAPDGAFTAEVPLEEECEIEFVAPGYLTRTIELDGLPPDGSLTVVLVRAPAIEGHVQDAEGSPLLGARVTAEGIEVDESGGTRTDVGGGFRIELPCAGVYAIEVEADGHVFPDDLEAATGSRGIEIRALSRPCIEGRVVGVDGEALVGPWVRVANEEDGRSWMERCDHRGRFRVTGLEGTSFRVSVEGLPRGVCVRSLAHVRPDTSGLVFQAVHARKILGRVVDASGVAVSRASVWARPEGHDAPVHACTSVDDGGFTLVELLPGLYRLEAERPVGPDLLEVSAFVWVHTEADADVVLVLGHERVVR